MTTTSSRKRPMIHYRKPHTRVLRDGREIEIAAVFVNAPNKQRKQKSS